jgi:ammonia channel protein AmtB
MNWDLVMAAAQAELGLFIVPILLNKMSYTPRLTSGGIVMGLIVITVTLAVGFNAPLGAGVAGLSALGWALVFAFRGTEREG